MDYEVKILWSEKSLRDLDSILEYLAEKWTAREIQNFKEDLFNRVNLIGKYPKLFQASHLKEGLRRSVLSSQTSIFYILDSTQNQVIIVRLFDNRMNIDKF